MIKEDAFGGTYNFRAIFYSVNGRRSWKEFDELKDIDQKYYCSNYCDVSVNKYGVKYGTSLKFWQNNGCINKIYPYGWFQWYFRYFLGTRSLDDEKQINRWKMIKMINDAGGKFDDYSISPKIRQILLHWGYEFTAKDFFNQLNKLMYKNELLSV